MGVALVVWRVVVPDMSLANPPLPSSRLFVPEKVIKHVRRRIAASVSMLAFWSAIALPALYLPLLITGIESVDGLVAFLSLFVLHVLALIGGQSHRRPSE